VQHAKWGQKLRRNLLLTVKKGISEKVGGQMDQGIGTRIFFFPFFINLGFYWKKGRDKEDY
jgi:hypothetical protein